METFQALNAAAQVEVQAVEAIQQELTRAEVSESKSGSDASSNTTALVTSSRAIRDEATVASPRAHVLHKIAAGVIRLALGLKAKNYIEAALKGPSRRPQGRVTGRYPSQRMGVSFGLEHGHLGLAALAELETDPTWEVFLDFPPALKHQIGMGGRKRSFLKAPTFLAMRAEKVVLISLHEARYVRHSIECADGRFVADGNDNWICPSADEAAAQLGFEHEVWTERRFNRTRVSNTELLYDYFCEGQSPPKSMERQACLLTALDKFPTPTIAELLDLTRPSADITDVLRAIATARLWVDLETDDLSRWEDVHIFQSAAALAAFKASEAAIARASDWASPSQRPLRSGDTIIWDGVLHRVLNVGLEECALESAGDLVTIKLHQLQELIASGSATLSQGSQSLADARRQDALDVLATSDPKSLEVAVLRLARIEPYLAGIKHSAVERSLRRYIAAFKASESACGNGLLGLIPRPRTGNRVRRIQEDVLKLVVEKVHTTYLDPRNKHAHSLWGEVALSCEEKGLPPPSYSWLCRYLKRLDQHKLVRARKGTKAAYQIAPRGPYADVTTVDIEPTRAMQIAHADHTEVDVETVFEDSAENAGRAYLSLLIDYFTRRILAMFLSYEPPSYRSVLMLIRECIRRFNRLPSGIVVDRGKEFRATWFRTLCAFLNVKLIDRPSSEPRYGAPMERMFGTANTNFFHHLIGNTQLTKNVRQVTKAVNPRTLAIWTLRSLDTWSRRYLYEEYDTTPHRGTLVTPRDGYERSVARFGTSASRFIANDARMILVTSPTTPKGTATVTVSGVKINYLWFNSRVLYPLVGQCVRVRYDPLDLGNAWAWVNGCWERIVSRYQRVLAGLSERLLAIVTEEYRKRRGDLEFKRLTDTKLVAFLREVETHEEFLLEQKRHKEVLHLLCQPNAKVVEEDARVVGTADSSDAVSDPSGGPSAVFSADLDDDLDMDVGDIELMALPAY